MVDALTGPTELRRGSAGWPEGLEHLADPPDRLWALGRMELLSTSEVDGPGGGGGPRVAIVGSRRATAYGRAVARELGAALAGIGARVLSGLAFGIDAAAHEGALESGGGGCVAVLGSGVDVATPRAHQSLHRRLIREGVVLSEYAPGTRARPWHFPARNRILAALADEIVVVEAAERSGALITARLGLDLGREVHAVPGRIDAPTSRGTNALIADGARPIVDVRGWVAEREQLDLRLTGVRSRMGPTGGARGAAWPAPVEALRPHLDGPIEPDELALRVGWPLARLLPELLALELAGRIERLPGPRFRAAG